MRLASHVYKVGDIEPWVRREGFTLMAEGETNCTRWYVCDKRAGEATTHRWVIVRGAAWNNEKVDRVRLSTQIGKAWPSPLHEGKGAPRGGPHRGQGDGGRVLAGRVAVDHVDAQRGTAVLRRSLARRVDGDAADGVVQAEARGGPARDGPVLDLRLPARAGVRRVGDAQAARRGRDRIGRSRRGGWRRLGRRAHARGWDGKRHGRRHRVRGGRGEGLGASTPSGSTETGSTPRGEARDDALRMAGFEPDSVRAFVLSNDPVPRMWLAADPLYAGAAANETVASLMSAREWLFGRGMLSRGRFLYDAAGTLYWMRWAPEAGTAVTVHRGDPDALCEELSRDGASFDWGRSATEGGSGGGSGGGTGERSWFDAGLRSVVGAMDHNAQNYVDSIQYLNVRRFTGSSSKAL